LRGCFDVPGTTLVSLLAGASTALAFSLYRRPWVLTQPPPMLPPLCPRSGCFVGPSVQLLSSFTGASMAPADAASTASSAGVICRAGHSAYIIVHRCFDTPGRFCASKDGCMAANTYVVSVRFANLSLPYRHSATQSSWKQIPYLTEANASLYRKHC
jgi:hypothetical protein